jgi:hypothetical protein
VITPFWVVGTLVAMSGTGVMFLVQPVEFRVLPEAVGYVSNCRA